MPTRPLQAAGVKAPNGRPKAAEAAARRAALMILIPARDRVTKIMTDARERAKAKYEQVLEQHQQRI